MQNSQLRGLYGLVAIGAATAVGIATHDAGFTALTFVGALIVPRTLGIGGRHRHGLGCSARGDGGPGGRNHRRDRSEQRLETWHRQAHGGTDPAPVPSSTPAGA